MSPIKKVFSTHANEHLANERTFLAWVRTAIAIMAFGFVVEKFSLFLKKIAAAVSKQPLPESFNLSSPQGYSDFFGVILVAIGGIICVLAYFKYRKTEKEIEADCYFPSSILDVMLTLALVLVGLSLVIYMIHNLIG